MMRSYQPRLGLEMEMAVIHVDTGASCAVARYFDALCQIKQSRRQFCDVMVLKGRCVGIYTESAICGLDNGFNLLETALAPVQGGVGGLDRLASRAFRELADTIEALRADQAMVLNASAHPDCRRDPQWYAQVCAPRPIYKELVGHRGWHHWEGIDAKAQNGANTSVPIEHAAQALNIMIGLAGASIALFANSPLESGERTQFKENRLTVWPRVFEHARFPGDFLLTQYPSRPFGDLGDYFRWMFGAGTVSRALPQGRRYDYKSAPTVLLDGDPCLTEFLSARQWMGQQLETGERACLVPDSGHFEYSQIAQFMDARWRYQLDTLPPLAELLLAWGREGGLEALFAACGVDGYIEGRAPGAGFADSVLLAEAGTEISRSMLMAPIALQLGVLENSAEAWQLVQDWGWDTLGVLRNQAMRHGLDDPDVRALCVQVLAVARGGLAHTDQHWLAYPQYVLDTGRTSADRTLYTWQRIAGTRAQRLAGVARDHAALHPQQYEAF
ncbi:hypothetical protein KVP09_14295 [Alcaligenaceae bacterium CGII-47]|nr:hypothetical protein [Alcaligenaceae bacterium CGII-47]